MIASFFDETIGLAEVVVGAFLIALAAAILFCILKYKNRKYDEGGEE